MQHQQTETPTGTPRSAPVDVLAVLGTNRMETSQIAAKLGAPRDATLRALRAAEAAGHVETVPTDARYWRRGAAVPLVWRAAIARVGGAS